MTNAASRSSTMKWRTISFSYLQSSAALVREGSREWVYEQMGLRANGASSFFFMNNSVLKGLGETKQSGLHTRSGAHGGRSELEPGKNSISKEDSLVRSVGA